MVYNIQTPRMECGRSERGEGLWKGATGTYLMEVYGQHALHLTNQLYLVGRFNSHLRDCVFLFADEAFYAGDTQSEGNLKRVVTESTLFLEAKGKDANKHAQIDCTY